MNKKSRNQAIKRLFKESFLGETLDFNTVKKVVGVILKLPYPYSLTILSEYKKQIFMYIDSKLLKIESAINLSETDISRIEGLFKSTYSLMYTKFEINEDLIAGVKITAGDNVFDTTIKNQIHSLLIKN